VGSAELRAAVLALARSIQGEEEPGTTVADAAVLRRLLAGLRAEVVECWRNASPVPAAAEVLDVAAAFDRVAAALDRRFPSFAGAPGGVEFVAGVAHDLRSPLTSILFLAETLLSGQSGEVNDVQRRQLGIIYGAALGLVSVASDIIELVRGGDGLTERKPALFSVTEILQSVHDIVRPMAEEKGLGVHLFPPAVDLRMGYPLALSRVLLNLTTNGLKFTDSGFVEIAVRAMGPARVEFSVRDTGKGYSTDVMDTLYEPFRRSHDGKKYGFSGAGLGLAISRKLVAAMGSTLAVETRPGWGTRFHFELDLPPATPG
jgi:signal transduction histidine kinase